MLGSRRQFSHIFAAVLKYHLSSSDISVPVPRRTFVINLALMCFLSSGICHFFFATDLSTVFRRGAIRRDSVYLRYSILIFSDSTYPESTSSDKSNPIFVNFPAATYEFPFAYGHAGLSSVTISDRLTVALQLPLGTAGIFGNSTDSGLG